jgi:hypothetical protein
MGFVCQNHNPSYFRFLIPSTPLLLRMLYFALEFLRTLKLSGRME